MSTLTAVILAGGQAKRMKSSVPKVLHRVAGRPMVCYPVRAALEVGADQVLVVVPPNHQPRIAEELDRQFGAGHVRTVVQPVPQARRPPVPGSLHQPPH